MVDGELMNCFYCVTVCILCETLTFFLFSSMVVMTSRVKVLLPQARQLDVTFQLCLQDYPCCIPHDVFSSHLALFFLACLSFFTVLKDWEPIFFLIPHHSIFIILLQLQIGRKHSVIMLKTAHIHDDSSKECDWKAKIWKYLFNITTGGSPCIKEELNIRSTCVQTYFFIYIHSF